MKELAEVKSSVLQLHKGAEKRLEAFIQVQPRTHFFPWIRSRAPTALVLMRLSQMIQAEHREWDQMLGSPSPKKMIGNGHLPDIHNKDVSSQLIISDLTKDALLVRLLILDLGIAKEGCRGQEGSAACCKETEAGQMNRNIKSMMK